MPDPPDRAKLFKEALMANILPFKCKHSGRCGFTIFSLPMPDGTYRAYKEYGKNALGNILARWKAECAEMKMILEVAHA